MILSLKMRMPSSKVFCAKRRGKMPEEARGYKLRNGWTEDGLVILTFIQAEIF